MGGEENALNVALSMLNASLERQLTEQQPMAAVPRSGGAGDDDGGGGGREQMAPLQKGTD
eukprot:gene23704-12643_t